MTMVNKSKNFGQHTKMLTSFNTWPCSLVFTLILLHGGLSERASTFPQDETANVFECERLDKNDPNCANGGCYQDCGASAMNSCFALWENGTDGMIKYLIKGCWPVEDNCINSSQCVQSPSIQPQYFCCCLNPRCNKNVKNVYYPPTSPPTSTEGNTAMKKLSSDKLTRTVIYSIVPLVGVAAVIVLVFRMWKQYKRHVYEYQKRLEYISRKRVHLPRDFNFEC